MLHPSATIGILGGGQLGRMTAMAAAQLGFRSHIFCQAGGEPAAQVAAATTIAAFDDPAALDAFGRAVDVVTLEFENVPLSTLERLSEKTIVRPGPQALAIAQDRQLEKEFFRDLGLPTAPFATVTSAEELVAARRSVGPRAILKTARFGYDGKGQLRLAGDVDLDAAWQDLRTDRATLETMLELEREFSVILARAPDGATACFDPAENEHRNNILHRTTVPARISQGLLDQAADATRRIARTLDLIGLLAVEFFVTKAGELFINEMAPRPHNSGHWTLDACAVSQFEQLVRAVAGLPLGDPARHSDADMLNLLGDDIDQREDYLRLPAVCLHLYGKAEARPGRKMGHTTTLKARSSGAG